MPKDTSGRTERPSEFGRRADRWPLVAAHVGLSVAVSVFAGKGAVNVATVAVLAMTVWLWLLPRGAAVPSLAHGPLFVAVYSLVEGIEGRGGSVMNAGIASFILGGLTIWWTASTSRPWTFVAAVLLAGLAFLSARTGGAGTMVPWFAGWLPSAWVGPVVIGVRKMVHATFYPALAYSVLRAEPSTGRGRAFLFVAIFAVFDEVRQSAIPGRTGSAWDVLLDLVAAGVLLFLLGRVRVISNLRAG